MSEKQTVLFEDSAPRDFTQRQRAMFGALCRMWYPGADLRDPKLKKRIGDQANMLAALGLTPHTFPVAIQNYQAKFGPSKDRPQGLACNARAIANNWEDVQPTPRQLVDVQLIEWIKTLKVHRAEVAAGMRRYVVLRAWGQHLPGRLKPAARTLCKALGDTALPAERRIAEKEAEWLAKCEPGELVI